MAQGLPKPLKVCRIMPFGLYLGFFGLLFYLLLGSRYDSWCSRCRAEGLGLGLGVKGLGI